MIKIPKIDAVIKSNKGDDGSLIVVMGSYKNRFVVYSMAHGKLITENLFNKRANANKKYKKILDEF